MVGNTYSRCPFCGGEDSQGCYSDCPTNLKAEVERLKAEVERLREMQRTALDAARPAIMREVLEEAAKVAEAKADEWTISWRKGLKIDSHLEGMSDGADDIAAAIRALIEKP